MVETNGLLHTFGPVLSKIFVYLLRQQHEDGSVPGANGAHATDDLKAHLTHDFIAALIACGYMGGMSLENAAKWFINLPVRQRLGRREMYQLEALLRVTAVEHTPVIAPPYGLVRTLVSRLVTQRNDNIYYYIDDMHPESKISSSLWAIKTLLRANEQGHIPGPAFYDRMCEDIGALLDDIRLLCKAKQQFLTPKDVSLALCLQYRLNGRLEPEHQDLLGHLLDLGTACDGMWSMQHSAHALLPEVWSHGFAPGPANERDWRPALVGTCHVIQNLALLRDLHPEIERPLGQTLYRLFDLIGRESPQDIHRYFIRDYHYIEIMCRLLIAARAWLGPLNPYLFPHVVDESVMPYVGLNDRLYTLDEGGILETLRSWFKIVYDGELEELTLGHSGAKVVRVHPRLMVPPTSLQSERTTIPIPRIDSLIVKYGARKDIETEVRNYRNLPAALQAMFAMLPEGTYAKNGHVFTVIQDLVDFEALQELLPRARHRGVEHILGCELASFLKDLYRSGLQPARLAPVGLARRLYLEPAWRYLGTVFSLFYDPQVYGFLQTLGSSDIERAWQIEAAFYTLLTHLYPHQDTLNRFRPVYMHGDLHIRNIMLRVVDNRREPLSIRLIDLESVTADGDYAYDVGELRASLDIFVAENDENRQLKPLADSLGEELREAYAGIARANDDACFDIRLALAECRALLRVAHAKSKAGKLHLDKGRPTHAANIVRESLNLVETALNRMTTAHRLLEAV
ncbi:MAG: hypothetical protein JXB47_04750 [Anaerolineae bacterium]|nr:hypothetical protein [Anaerolineae bacterium]